MSPTCPVIAAFNDGNAGPDVDGFWLRLVLRDGTVLRGNAQQPNNGLVALQVFREACTDLMREPWTYVRCADVMTATIEH